MAASPQAIATFGPGILMVTRIDIANQTPINIGKAQEFSLSFKGTSKELFGQNQMPDLVARGTVKVTGKMKSARLSGIAVNSVFFGGTLASGGFQWNTGEANTPVTTTYQVTNHATFDQDLGVLYAATGQPLIKVASAPTVGQYSVVPATGTYTINATDENNALLFNYTSTVATGQQLTYTNQPIGTTPVFQLDYWNNVNQPTPSPFAIRLFSCVADSFALAFKLEDFNLPEFNISCFCNAAGNLMEMVLPNTA
jgi:hypothetical protein